MKKNSYHLYACTLLMLLMFVFLPATSASRQEEEDVLIRAFRVSGASIVESNINIYSSSQNLFLDREGMLRTVKALAGRMGLDFYGSQRQEHFSDGYNQITVAGRDSSGHSVVLIGHSMDFASVDEEGGVETNIVLDISSDGNLQDLPGIKRKAKRAVEDFIQGARVTSCIVGSYEGRMDGEQMIEVIGSILEKVEAREIERTEYDGMISVSAYTPLIGEYLEVGENRININIAMRYNSFEGKTYIWLGSPVITLEY